MFSEIDLIHSKTVWGLKRLNIAYYISLILGCVNIFSELVTKSIYDNWEYKAILIIVYGSFILVNKKINQDLSLVKYVSFLFGEILNCILIYFAYIEEPECALIWIQMSGFVVTFYQSYLLTSVKSIIIFSVKHTLEWAIAGIYFNIINMNNLAPFISGLFALPIFMFACLYFDYLQDIDLCKSKAKVKIEVKKIKNLVEAISDSIFVINIKLEAVFMNPAGKSLLQNFNFQDYIRKMQYHIRYPQSSSQSLILSEDIKCSFSYELNSDCSFGVTKESELFVEWSGKVVLWENETCVILLGKNVSRIIKLEKDSEENQYKSILLRTVSHELRTPTNAILSMAELLKESQQITGDNVEKLDLMVSSCTYLLCLINDLLDYSQIMAGSLKISKIAFDVNQIMSECMKLIQVQLTGSTIKLAVNYLSDVPHGLISDPYRIKQIILNLLSNARKFTVTGHISLEVEHKEPYLIISCQDTGVGIPEDQIPKLFTQFGRLDTSNLNPQGVGLGLYISNMLTYELGGSGIKVKSTLGTGSTFSFSIEVEEMTQYQLADDIPDENPSITLPNIEISNINKGREVLIVDDTYFNILAFKHILKSEGYRCDYAINGKDAIEKIKNKAYVCIIMDCEMPILDGWNTTKELKRMLRLGQIQKLPPIVGCTAHSSEVVKYRCQECGMVDFILKPCPRELIVEKVNNWARGGF